MEKLVRGLHILQTTHFSQHQDLFTQLSKGQSPETLLITCSDSRIMPGLLTQSKPGDLFVLRNAGNIVPPYGASNGGEGATIEYAVDALNVRHIIVMGHSLCGALKGLMQPEDLQALPLVAEWLKHAEATRRVRLENYPEYQDNELLNAAIKGNVLVQLDNLRTYPAVAARLAKGNLILHALVYQIEQGQILAYDSDCLRFVPLTADYAGAIVEHRPRLTLDHQATTGLERAA